jgi:hypothetical protein
MILINGAAWVLLSHLSCQFSVLTVKAEIWSSRALRATALKNGNATVALFGKPLSFMYSLISSVVGLSAPSINGCSRINAKKPLPV